MYYVYAIFSPGHEKIYIGQSSSLVQRLDFHNRLSKSGWTIKYRPWELLYNEEVSTRGEALKREKQLKSAKGRIFVWEKVREYKEILRGRVRQPADSSLDS